MCRSGQLDHNYTSTQTDRTMTALMNLFLILSFVHLLQAYSILGSKRNTCDVKYFKTGCYRDVRFQEALPELLFQDRCEVCPKYGGELIDWFDFGPYLKRLACRCAAAAKAKGYTNFGLQFYGVCYSGPKAATQYAKYGPINKCVNELQIACDDEKTEECVGLGNANYIYRI